MKTIISSRTTVLACLLLAGFVALEWRLIHLQVLRHDELEAKAEDYHFTTRVEQAWRGQIQDRNGVPLALTVPVKNVYADLEVWTNRVEFLSRIIAPLLGTNQASVSQRVRQSLNSSNTSDRDPGVLLLKRGVAPAEWAAIKDALAGESFGLQTNKLSSRQRTLLKRLRRRTVYAEDDQRRFFPHGESMGQVLGFTGTGTNGHLLQGKWGIEASLDNLLAGQNGFCDSSKDAAGNELSFCRTTDVTARDGAEVVLTIDLKLQKIVEAALAKVVARYRPSNASCVVVSPATGEILAMASWPTFSPQQPGRGSPGGWCNHVISDRNEVGSVFKVFTLAAALELGVVNLDQPINCENGLWIYKKSKLHDDGHRYDILTVRECLAKSSNIGLAKIALPVGTNRFYDYICRFGFDRATGLRLPYESPGSVRLSTNPAAITQMAIGHGFAVSQLQLAMAYAAIANDGKLMRPMLVRQVNHSDGTLWARYEPQAVRSVVRPETARRLRDAMQDVVESGTGKAAALPDYTVAGKTGTAQKSDGHRYVRGRIYSSFVGLVPAGKPEFVIAVAVDEPKDSVYGGIVAAPVFREIAEQALDLYDVAPDKVVNSARPIFASKNQSRPTDLIAMDH